MALTRKDCWDGRHMKFYEVFRKEVYNGDDSFVNNLEKFGVFRYVTGGKYYE